jgi:hypothetical protein
MPSSDQASQKSQPSIARASRGGGRPCCDVARGAGNDGSPMDRTSDRVPLRKRFAFVAGNACRPATPAHRSPILRSHRCRLPRTDYTNMTTALSHIDCSSAPPVPRRVPHRRFRKAARYDLAGPPACASRLTSDDAARSATLPLGTLTRRFAQNKSEIAGLGCRQVNFASAVFSLEHSSIRQGSHEFNWGVA